MFYEWFPQVPCVFLVRYGTVLVRFRWLKLQSLWRSLYDGFVLRKTASTFRLFSSSIRHLSLKKRSKCSGKNIGSSRFSPFLEAGIFGQGSHLITLCPRLVFLIPRRVLSCLDYYEQYVFMCQHLQKTTKPHQTNQSLNC